MHRSFLSAFLLLACGLPTDPVSAADLPERSAWINSHVQGTPEPPPPYRTLPRFTAHAFAQPLDLIELPGTGLLVIAELNGRIRAFARDRDDAAPLLLMDAKKHVAGLRQFYGMAADPDFANNRQIYLCYKTANDDPLGTTVARFLVRGEGADLKIDPDSRQLILQWYGGGHNGGSLQFGPDGMLYISAGDGAAPWPPDSMNVGQNLGSLLSTILRIDVRGSSPQKPYAVPADNPFVALAGAKPEIWAFGFRNPWRMSFDRKTGSLWTGDVGWELWEMIHRVERGGNYGWPVMEGPQSIRSDVTPGPGEIRTPVAVHSHTEARSITGGFVYRGTKRPELRGKYLYGDFETGRLWSLNAEGEPGSPVLLCDTPLKPVAFGQDLAGEVYILDFGGGIHELAARDPGAVFPAFPRRLSETGLFANTASQIPATGVAPYSLRASMWCDGLQAARWMGLPGTQPVRVENRGWQFPAGSVLAKTLSLPGTGDQKPRPVETRLLHFDGDEWQAYSYQWRADQQDADLVDAEGAEAIYTTDSGPFRHVFQPRNACLVCHNFWSGYALGFNAQQLDGAGGIPMKQWVDRSYLDKLPPSAAPLADPLDASAGTEARVRAWLHVNCAHCHKREAGGTAAVLLSSHLPLQQMHLIDEKPTQGSLGLADAVLVKPGDPIHSVLYYRLATAGIGHMPRLGSETTDEKSLELVYQWIISLDPAARSEPKWTALPEPLETLLADPAGALRLQRQIALGAFDAQEKSRIVQQALASPLPEVHGLFQRWAPVNLRPGRLGPQPAPGKILALSGNEQRGRKLYFSASAAVCRACHKLGSEGGTIGPDLSGTGRRLKREEILESLLDPARRVEPAYRLHRLKTRDGQERTGNVAEQSPQRVLWRDPAGTLTEIPASEIESLTPLPGSLMPVMLLKDFTAQDAADLIDFLKAQQQAP